MELLAPAGSFEQALVSINSGCDALYGGLKKWSARSRAVNLSDEEYRDLIEICNRKGKKFYLTLNTLMSDQEIDQIVQFFENPNNPRPHGVLVGDIGLFGVLSDRFPELSIHASTQFGAYSLSDVRFFQSLGINRVVLARELTLDEISKIRKQTDAELEVFVYGNQCVVFSGNCLWGGLTHSGSGHKGCCIGTCNDIFETEQGEIGEYLWANNIGLFGMVESLRDVGVDSIKIEGRVRPIDEVERVVSQFKESINGINKMNDYDYEGYLGGVLPPPGMFSKYNPEHSCTEYTDFVFTDHDYLLDETENVKRIAYGNATHSNKYIFTVFRKKWLVNKNNIFIRYGFVEENETKIITRIEYFRVNGTHNILSLSQVDTKGLYTRISVGQLYSLFEDKITVNIYEFKSKLPENCIVEVDLEALDQIIDMINADVSALPCEDAFSIDENLDVANTFLMVDSVYDIDKYYNVGYREFIFVIKHLETLKQCIAMEQRLTHSNIIYRLPYLDFSNRLDEVYELVRGHKVMITRVSQLLANEKYHFAKIYGDYMLNVWNSHSALWLRQRGVRAVIAHPEISMAQINEIESKSGLELITIAASKIPFGFTRACFCNMNLCGCNCDNHTIRFHNTFKDSHVDILCDNMFGYRTIIAPDYYVAANISTKHRNVVGLIGVAEKDRDAILSNDEQVYLGKERIYTSGYEKNE